MQQKYDDVYTHTITPCRLVSYLVHQCCKISKKSQLYGVYESTHTIDKVNHINLPSFLLHDEKYFETFNYAELSFHFKFLLICFVLLLSFVIKRTGYGARDERRIFNVSFQFLILFHFSVCFHGVFH